MGWREARELAEVAAGFNRRVELRAHQFVVSGQLAVPYSQFVEGELRLELESVGVFVAEGHVDAAVSAVSSQHEALGEAGRAGRDGEAFAVQGGDKGYGDVGKCRVGVAFFGDP